MNNHSGGHSGRNGSGKGVERCYERGVESCSRRIGGRGSGRISSKFAVYCSVFLIFIFLTAGYHKKAMVQTSTALFAVSLDKGYNYDDNTPVGLQGMINAESGNSSVMSNNQQEPMSADVLNRAGSDREHTQQITQKESEISNSNEDMNNMPESIQNGLGISQGQIQDQTQVQEQEQEQVQEQEQAGVAYEQAYAQRPIVFVGDSLMYEAVMAMNTFYEYAYITWYNEIKNRSDYGLHTAQLVYKVWDIISLNPRKVFINGGTNDLWGAISPDQAAWNIYYIVDRIKENIPDCQIIMHTIPPFGRQAYAKNGILSSIQEVDRYNSLLSIYAAQKQVILINVNALYRDEEGYMSSEYSTDGVHIAMPYYRKWLNEYLNKAIL